MMDRFFLGGPMTLRGFESRGIGNLNNNMAGVTVIKNLNLNKQLS
jgi:outer membrane protein assembly factor BamA